MWLRLVGFAGAFAIVGLILSWIVPFVGNDLDRQIGLPESIMRKIRKLPEIRKNLVMGFLLVAISAFILSNILPASF